jgi:hypothetical protein
MAGVSAWKAYKKAQSRMSWPLAQKHTAVDSVETVIVLSEDEKDKR